MKSMPLHCGLIALVLLMAVCPPLAAGATQMPEGISTELLDALRSTTLDLSDLGEGLGTFTLVDGRWEAESEQEGETAKTSVRLYPDPDTPVVGVGNLTGDDADEIVAVLTVDTETSMELTVVMILAVDDGLNLVPLASADLGERTQIGPITVEDGQAVMDVVFVDERDEVCYPGFEDILHLFFENDVLQIVSEGSDAEPPFAGDSTGQEEDPAAFYERLVAEGTVQPGVFTLYQLENGWYAEIPLDMLGRPFYWYSELSQVSPYLSSQGVGLSVIDEKMVAFEQMGSNIVVNELSSVTTKRSYPGKDASLDRAVAESALPSVLLTLPIVGKSPSGTPVVDLGFPLRADLVDFSLGSIFQSFGDTAMPDLDRSFIRDMDAYPNGIGVSSLLTFLVTPPADESFDMGMPPPPFSQSAVVRHSITLLPDQPMAPRYGDPRVGYFTVAYEDYSGTEGPDVVLQELITRYRLEKQDPTAELSEPVQPIVFYISREVPDRWRSYIKQGVEDWLPAFEAAGFKNAIVVKDAPTVEEDPNWDPADTRYSVIRWVAQAVSNAIGPNTVDPRTGEILSAHVQLFADLPELIEQWYFVQASAVDERARKLPLPDDILGPALREVVAHEVGHALGLRHNHKASQAFTIAQLRDPEFTAQHGTSPSIMSYGRYNYVTQPGDGVTDLIPQLGPYDVFAIQWGYMPIAGAGSPEDERATLDAWASRQIDEPWLRFGGEDLAGWVDPTVQTENLGDDRIEATRLGIANLERVMDYLVEASTSLGSDYSKTQQTYASLLEHRYLWLESVVKLVGGVEETRTLAGRGDAQFHRVPKAKQHEAVQFVLKHLQTPAVFMPPEVLDRLAPTDVLRWVSPDGSLLGLQEFQLLLLEDLLAADRLSRLAEGEVFAGAEAYPPIDYLADLETGLFAELKQGDPHIDPLRRELQQRYVDILQTMAGGDFGGELRSVARWSLKTLLSDLSAAEAKSSHATTVAHVAALSDQIETILETPPGLSRPRIEQ